MCYTDISHSMINFFCEKYAGHQLLTVKQLTRVEIRNRSHTRFRLAHKSQSSMTLKNFAFTTQQFSQHHYITFKLLTMNCEIVFNEKQ